MTYYTIKYNKPTIVEDVSYQSVTVQVPAVSQSS